MQTVLKSRAELPLNLVARLFLVKILWAWTIPDLSQGAVEQGLIAEEISWHTSFVVAIFVSALAGVAGIRHGEKS